jgi:molybdopterin converting factor small subunit
MSAVAGSGVASATPVRITFKLFAGLARHLPAGTRDNRLELELAPATPVTAVLDRFHVPHAAAHLVLINGIYVEPAARACTCLADGDVLAVWPPVAGG